MWHVQQEYEPLQLPRKQTSKKNADDEEKDTEGFRETEANVI